MKIYTNSTSINDLISGAMDKMKVLVDTSTIVGESIIAQSGDVIVPISKVAVGFVVGGGEYADLSARRVSNHFPMSGGSSGGMSVCPVGFLILRKGGGVEFVNVENKSLYQTVLNTISALATKLDAANVSASAAKMKEAFCGKKSEHFAENTPNSKSKKSDKNDHLGDKSKKSKAKSRQK